MGLNRVRLESTHVVTPAESTVGGILPLSELDQVDVISHTSVLYFYGKPTKNDWVDPSRAKVIDTLIASLSRALVPFYPLAGRLSWVAGRRLQLDCNAMGAELIEAESRDKISDFDDFVECSKTMFRYLVPHIDYANTPIQELPLLSVQVTGFACGGICLGIQFSHVLMDGRSVFHFIEEWARLARGEPLGVAPYLDRLALKHKLETKEAAHVVEPTFGRVTDALDELRLPTLVLLTADRIERLKKVANYKGHVAETPLCRPYSRFEIITANVWRCMTKARELETDQITVLYVIADGRTRLDPPLPSSYFGNAIVPVTTSSSAGELCSRPLSYACCKVRQAIQQLTNEYIRKTIDFFEKEASLMNHQFLDDRGDLVVSSKSHKDMWVTCSLNVLAQGLDFGWGKEIYAGPPTGLGGDGNTLILPHNYKNGSVKLAIWLENDEKCLKFVQYCNGRDTE